MCRAASCGRSDRLPVPSPPWPSTFQQQFVPACLGVAVAAASSPLRSCWSVLTMANCLLGEPQSPYTTIIAVFHVVAFDFIAPLRQTVSRLTIRGISHSSFFSSMDSMAAKIQALGDLELAVLLCLVAQQHCIISTQNLLLDTLAHELQLVCPSLL
jgi:hypothetical protein